MTGEATGEIWTWSLLGVKVLSRDRKLTQSRATVD